MSAIYGILNPQTISQTDINAAKAMSATLSRRGSTDIIHTSQHIIIAQKHNPRPGLSEKPSQNENAQITAVLDGSILNANELIADLRRKGHAFNTASDPEILAHAIESYGENLPKKLRGSFALAIWDESQQLLTLARDRAGEKNLYYAKHEKTIIFASEIKTILAHPAVKRRLNPISLHHLLTLQRIPGDTTMFVDILKVQPASVVTVQLSQPPAKQQYWFPQRIKTEKKSTARTESADILETLRQSVKANIPENTQPGAFLTGGIDSSAIAVLLGAATNNNSKNYSLVIDNFQGPGDYTRHIAKQFGMQHTEIQTTAAELIKSIPSLLWNCDEPMADPASLPFNMLCEHASPESQTILCGEGGDVLFAGEERYVADKYLHYYTVLPPSLRKNLFAPLFTMASHSVAPGEFTQRLEQMAAISPMSDAERHASWLQFFSHNEKLALYTPELARELINVVSSDVLQNLYDSIEKNRNLLTPSAGKGFTEQQLLIDFLTYLPETRLAPLGRAASSNNIDIRYPFLSKEIIEMALSLPAALKLKGATTKRILKQALWNTLPTEVLYRQEHCLQIPLDDWFRTTLREPARDILTDTAARSRGIFSPAAVQKLLQDHETSARDNGRKLWILLNIELWHRMFIDNPPENGPAYLL